MDNSTSGDTWDDVFNVAASEIDAQMAQPDFDLWDPIFFSNTSTQDEAMTPHSLANPNDSIIATPQSVHNVAANNQMPSSNPDNEPFPTGQPAPQIHTLPLEDSSVIQDTKKEARELLDALQEVKRELVIVKGQYQTMQSELKTVRSNHAKLLRWSIDMGEAMKALGKWLAETTGANIVGQDGLHVEEMASG